MNDDTPLMSGMGLQPPGATRRPLPPADVANGPHALEYAALARFLAVRNASPEGPTMRQAENELLCVLKIADGLDRVRDAFERRLARQKAGADIKGAAATQSAMRLIDETTRP